MEYENNDAEHFRPDNTTPMEVEVNIDRYRWVLPLIAGKRVLDLGCGGGLGTYLYSLVAEKVYALDYDARAIEEAKRYPFPEGKVEFLHGDILNIDFELPEVDVVVALEVLEHLEDPKAVLKRLKAHELVFSVPLHSLEVSTFHKFPIDTPDDVRKLIGPFYDVNDYEIQEHKILAAKWVHGHGIRYEGSD